MLVFLSLHSSEIASLFLLMKDVVTKYSSREHIQLILSAYPQKHQNAISRVRRPLEKYREKRSTGLQHCTSSLPSGRQQQPISSIHTTLFILLELLKSVAVPPNQDNYVSIFTILHTLHESGSSWQKNRTWCKTRDHAEQEQGWRGRTERRSLHAEKKR